MSDTTTTIKDKIQSGNDSCAQAASSTVSSACEAGSYLGDQARTFANNASQNASNAGNFLDQRARQATSAVGGGLRSAGEAIRQHLPRDGRVGQASNAVAEQFTATGNYLQREGLQGIGDDLTSLIKNNPIPSLLIGIGLGFLLARTSSTRD